MNKVIITIGLYLLFCLSAITMAGEDFISEQRKSFDTMSPEKAAAKRQKILDMSSETLERLYKLYPETKEKIENAYGYGVFEAKAVNLVIYVAGNGFGVVFDNKTKTPIFMNSIRAGTGPGIGYKSLHGVFIFKNEAVYTQFTTIGVQLSASADAVVKVAGIGAEIGEAISLIPGISYYQLTDTGLVLQANWGITEFLRNPDLN
ncbi:MAG: hypothetical protein QM504_03830 [Pseudomonadota bacterium]